MIDVWDVSVLQTSMIAGLIRAWTTARASISCMIIAVNACWALLVVHASMICVNAMKVCAVTLAHVTWDSMGLLNATAIRFIRVFSVKHVSDTNALPSDLSIRFQAFILVFPILVPMVARVWLEETKWLVFVETSLLEINAKNVSISKTVCIASFTGNKCHVSSRLPFPTETSVSSLAGAGQTEPCGNSNGEMSTRIERRRGRDHSPISPSDQYGKHSLAGDYWLDLMLSNANVLIIKRLRIDIRSDMDLSSFNSLEFQCRAKNERERFRTRISVASSVLFRDVYKSAA